MNHKLVAPLLLLPGFLAGAYVSVARVESVNWMHYAACAGLMLAGLVVVRLGRGSAALDSDKHDQDLDVLQASVDRLIDKVDAYTTIADDEQLTRLHTRIDAELMDDIGAFVEARESMIPRLGMQHYADIMSPFATGERLLNRAWSASADGYVDEVRLCVGRALAELRQTSSLLQAARPDL